MKTMAFDTQTIETNLFHSDAHSNCFGDCWISYPIGETRLQQLNELFSYPDSVRTPGLLIYGRSNSGKTMLVRKFKKDVDDWIEAEYPDTPASPVQIVETPPDRPTPKAFYRELLQAIGAPRVESHTSERLLGQVMELYQRNSVQILIVDEIHNIAAAAPGDQAGFLNVLKYLSNQLNIRVVAVGTEEAYRVLQLDQQLGSRFRPAELGAWKVNDVAYAKFIFQLIQAAGLQPTKENSSKRFVEFVHALSEGLTGETKDLIMAAAHAALFQGKGEIDLPLLESLAWTPPMMRYR